MLIAHQIQSVLGLHGGIDLKTLRIHINKLGCVHPSKTCLKEFNKTPKRTLAWLGET
jgi:hypothetical protein